jgi:hypothetical protein
MDMAGFPGIVLIIGLSRVGVALLLVGTRAPLGHLEIGIKNSLRSKNVGLLA